MISTNKQRLFILTGIPGSGKTTLSKSMVESLGDNVVHISRDDIRCELKGCEYSREVEAKVFKCYISKIATSLKLGYDVIADSTNLTKSKRYIYFALCEALKKSELAEVDVIGVFVSTPLSKCIERNSRRTGMEKVPEEVIESMHSTIEEPSYDEGFRVIMNKA